MKTLRFSILVALLFLLGGCATYLPRPTSSTQARVYVITGQGGKATSGGMVQLASRLARIPGLAVSTHGWKRPGIIVEDIKHNVPPGVPVILVGYSLGANATTWISNAIGNREVALAVAYDPSIYSYIQPARGNVRRMLLYHNNGRSMLGHARIPGEHVETLEVRMGHLSVDWSQKLHTKTINAIMQVIK